MAAPAQTAFKDYIGALVLHKSSVSGMYLRDDPTILGWELTNSAVCPGDDSGDTVQASHGDGSVPLIYMVKLIYVNIGLTTP